MFQLFVLLFSGSYPRYDKNYCIRHASANEIEWQEFSSWERLIMSSWKVVIHSLHISARHDTFPLEVFSEMWRNSIVWTKRVKITQSDKTPDSAQYSFVGMTMFVYGAVAQKAMIPLFIRTGQITRNCHCFPQFPSASLVLNYQLACWIPSWVVPAIHHQIPKMVVGERPRRFGEGSV